MATRAHESAYQVQDIIAEDIDAYLLQHQHKSLLRFITGGSVDDGKSTLIGRLLYDSKMIFEDQLAALESDSKKVGTQGGEIELIRPIRYNDGLDKYRLTAKELKAKFESLNADTVFAFQTRCAAKQPGRRRHRHRRRLSDGAGQDWMVVEGGRSVGKRESGEESGVK